MGGDSGKGRAQLTRDENEAGELRGMLRSDDIAPPDEANYRKRSVDILLRALKRQAPKP
jgi:hypothetical protein